jgi:SAM-dependent methyltransferase
MDNLINKIDFNNADEKFYFTFHLSRYKYIIQLLKKYTNQKSKILDVGGYPFHLMYYIDTYISHNIISLDFNTKTDRTFIKKNNLNIKKCNIEQDMFPIKKSTMDIIILSEVFEHLGCNPLFTLKEIYRTLSSDGVFIITTPNLYSLKNIFLLFIGRGINNPYTEYIKLEQYGYMGHIREYSKYELTNLLQKMNFKIISHEFKQYDIPLHNNFKNTLLKLILFFLPFFKSSQIFVCKKQ